MSVVSTRGSESRSTVRVMDILDLFFNVREGLTLTEISRRLGVPKSSTHALLQAMRRRGYLSWDPRTKAFSIGLRVVVLAQASPILHLLRERARPYLDRLSATLHETVMLGAYESDSVVCVETVESPDPVRFTVQLGERRPLHCTSLGKLYLASLDDAEVRRLLDVVGLGRQTDQTVTRIEELLEELHEIRRAGYAANRAESIAGVYSFGVPIRAHGGALVAGMSVVGASERMLAKKGEIVAELVAAARRLSADLGGPPDVSRGGPDHHVSTGEE